MHVSPRLLALLLLSLCPVASFRSNKARRVDSMRWPAVRRGGTGL
jgi:hypothetical protein